MFKEVEFKSVGELVDAVLSGRKIYNKTENDCLVIGALTINWVKTGRPINLSIIDVSEACFKEEIDWRETLKDKPVWCWVWNDDDNCFTNIALVSDYHNNCGLFAVKDEKDLEVYHYRNAEPVNADSLSLITNLL